MTSLVPGLRAGRDVSLMGDALELIHGADAAFRTIDAVIFKREDPAVRDRAVAADNSNAPGGLDHEVRETVSRLWIEKPDRYRLERLRLPSSGVRLQPAVIVQSGRDRWLLEEGRAVKSTMDASFYGTIEFHGLLWPHWVVQKLWLDHVEPASAAGRSGFRLSGTHHDDWDDSPMSRWPERGTEYEIVVDGERGIILRLEARFEGVTFNLIEVRHVEFDPVLPASTFVFTPPPGVLVEDEPSFEWVTLDEAAERAPFSLLVPDMPDKLFLRCVSLSSGGKHGPFVTQHFIRPEAPCPHRIWDLDIRQSPFAFRCALPLDYEARMIGDLNVLIYQGVNAINLSCAVGDTEVSISCSADLDFALEALQSLRPYERGDR